MLVQHIDFRITFWKEITAWHQCPQSLEIVKIIERDNFWVCFKFVILTAANVGWSLLHSPVFLSGFLSCSKLCPVSSVCREFFLSFVPPAHWSLLFPTASPALLVLCRAPASCCHLPSRHIPVHPSQQEQPPFPPRSHPKKPL